MNKQLTKKTIGIAASAALMAAALSATAVAGPPANKGPKPSITVNSVCGLAEDAAGAPLLKVVTTVTDKNYPTGLTPYITDASISAILGIGSNKGGGKKPDEPKWYIGEMSRTGDDLPSGDVENSVTFTSYFSLCDDARTKEANAANSLVTVFIAGGHKEDGWTSYCSDDPTTYEVEGGVPIGHLGLCAQ